MYPIYFKDNTCVKCGTKNIVALDTNNNIVVDESYKDIRKAICINCKAKYIFKWDSEEEHYPVDRLNIERFKEKFNN